MYYFLSFFLAIPQVKKIRTVDTKQGTVLSLGGTNNRPSPGARRDGLLLRPPSPPVSVKHPSCCPPTGQEMAF